MPPPLRKSPFSKPPAGAQVNWDHPLASRLVRAWLTNEGSGKVVFDAAQHEIAVWNGVPRWMQPYSTTAVSTGNLDRALQFIASNADFVQSQYVFPTTNFTLSFWAQTNVNGSSNRPCGAADFTGGLNGVSVVLGLSANTIYVILRQGANNNTRDIVNVAPPFSQLKGPHHYVVTVDAVQGARLFYDGLQIGQNTGTLSITTGGLKFRMGEDANQNSSGFNGYLSNVYIYERALSPAEVKWLFAEPYAMFRTPSLVWQLGGPFSAPVTVALGASAAQSSATLAVTAATQVPLAASAAQSSTSLALTATTQVPLGTSAAASSTSLALTAPTTVPLGSSVAVSSASLALTAATVVTLGQSVASSSASLALSAETVVPLDASAAVSSATLALAVVATVPLGSSDAQSAATLSLTATSILILGASAAVSTATLTLVVPHQVTLQPSNAISAATLAISMPHEVVLQPSSTLSTATLALGQFIPGATTGTIVFDVDGRTAGDTTGVIVTSTQPFMLPGRTGETAKPITGRIT